MKDGRTGRGGEGWSTLPPDLQALNRYLPWTAVRRANGGTGKCPMRARGQTLYPVQAASPAAWLPLADALRWVETGQADGVGICLPPGMIGLDLDGVYYGGELEEWAAELVDKADSYTEKSPSGVGLHILGYHPVARLPGRLTGMFRVEVLTAERFLTVTGQAVKSRPLRDLADVVPIPARPQVPAVSRSTWPVEHAALVDRIARGRSGALFQQLYVDGDISRYPSWSEADLALCRLFGWWCDGNLQHMDQLFRGSALYRPKWDLHFSAETYGERTLRMALT